MAALKPLYDKVLVKRTESEERTAGGIILPDSAQEKPQQGEVVAVGKGTMKEDGSVIPLEIQVGDKVLFAKWGGTEITVDGQELLVMKESDILAVFEK